MIRAITATLLILLAACAGGPVVFSGKDIEYERGFVVRAKKDRDRVLLVRDGHSLGLSLPYAEDWSFESTSRAVILARSHEREMIATVRASSPVAPVAEDVYLTRILKNVRETLGEASVSIADGQVVKHADHFVLECTVRATSEGADPEPQSHFWGMRQAPGGVVYEVHLATSCPPGPKLDDLRSAARSILAVEFALLPPRR
jgi:hypothetical protein